MGYAGAALLALPLCPLSIHGAQAEPWTAVGKISESLEYDSNPLLRTEDPEALWGSVTTPQLTIKGETPRVRVNLDNRVEVNRFDDTDFNSVDAFGTYSALYSAQTWSAGLNGKIDYDTTRTSELEGSGNNVAGNRRRAITLAPISTINVSQLDQLQLNPSVLDVAYRDKTTHTPYRVYGGSAIWQRSFTPRNAGLLAFQGSRYETRSGRELSIDTWSPQLGWMTSLMENLTLTVRGGIQRSKSKGVSSGSDQDYSFNADLSYKTLQNTLLVRATRSPNPQSDGSQAQATTFVVSDVYTIHPRLNASVYLYHQISEYSSLRRDGETSYTMASPKLTYKLYEDVELSLNYRYRHQENIVGEKANSNSVLLGVSVNTDQFGLW